MDCEASRCAVCSRVVWSGWLTSAGWKEGSGVKEENATGSAVTVWHPHYLSV